MHNLEIQSGRFLSHLYAYKMPKTDVEKLCIYCWENKIRLEREFSIPKRFFKLLEEVNAQAELCQDEQSVWYHLDFVMNCFIDQQRKVMLDLNEVNIHQPEFVQDVFDEGDWCMLNSGYIAKGCLVHSQQIEQNFEPAKLTVDLFCPRAYEKLFMLRDLYYDGYKIENVDVVQVPKDYHDIHIQHQGSIYALSKDYAWQKF